MIIKNTDENKGEPIHFKEERKFTAKHRIPSNGNLLENFMPSKHGRGNCVGKWLLAYVTQKSLNLYIGRAYVKDS